VQPPNAVIAVAKNLIGPTPLAEPESVDGHQRRLVVSITTLIVGTILLGISLQSPPGGMKFYVTAGRALQRDSQQNGADDQGRDRDH
jgi:hypothetical protein